MRFTEYVGAALDMRGAAGAELEYNQALKIPAGGFPLQLLAPEVRATTSIDAGGTAGTWLDRLFAVSSAARVGITMRNVPAGTASFPVTTAGAEGAQQAKSEATTAAAWTVGVREMRPKRGSVRAVFSIEDQARLPGLEDALQRDLRAALADSIDAAIFKGDSGPAGTSADIVGLQTAAITEFTLSQANKVKGPQTLAEFISFVDGKHAESLADLGIVASVGANVLWASTLVNASVDNSTIAQFLMANGLSWGARADIDTNTANGDFGAYVGLRRGQEGAAVAAVWEAGTLIRDPYSDAGKGEVAMTVNYLWDFAVPRPSSFSRLKFVS